MAKSTFKSQNLNSNLEIDNLIAISNILPSTMIDRFCKRIAKSIIQSQNLLSNLKPNHKFANRIAKSTIKSQNRQSNAQNRQ